MFILSLIIYNGKCKIFIYWLIFKILSSRDSQKMRPSNSLTISIYRDILKDDIDIRKLQMIPALP